PGRDLQRRGRAGRGRDEASARSRLQGRAAARASAVSTSGPRHGRIEARRGRREGAADGEEDGSARGASAVGGRSARRVPRGSSAVGGVGARGRDSVGDLESRPLPRARRRGALRPGIAVLYALLEAGVRPRVDQARLRRLPRGLPGPVPDPGGRPLCAGRLLHALAGIEAGRGAAVPCRRGREDVVFRAGGPREAGPGRGRHRRAPDAPRVPLPRRPAPLRAAGRRAPGGGGSAARLERRHGLRRQRPREGPLAMIAAAFVLTLMLQDPSLEPPPRRPRVVRSSVRIIIEESPRGDYEFDHYEQPLPSQYTTGRAMLGSEVWYKTVCRPQE